MYNWQHPDWPNIRYDREAVRSRLVSVADQLTPLLAQVRKLGSKDRRDYLIETMVREAQYTSRIEGEFMSKEDLRSSILNHLYLGNYKKRSRDTRSVGIGKLMSTIAGDTTTNITEASLKYWHQLLFSGTDALARVGDYRVGPDPMQIISGPDYDPTIHFLGPPAAIVPEEMIRFIQALDQPHDPDPIINSILLAGWSHVYFESIHPFPDGNGRIGRAMIEGMLARGIGFSLPFSVSAVISKNTGEYYHQLKQAQASLEISPWMDYFVSCVGQAITDASIQISFLLQKSRVLAIYQESLSERQMKVILRLFDEGPSGFTGGLSSKKYARLTRTSRATATRELSHLTRLGVLIRRGSGRSVRYELNLTA